ncbi:hypothetical protein R6Q59_021294 [Mikania micrantha]
MEIMLSKSRNFASKKSDILSRSLGHSSDLVDLMMELVDTYKIRLPKFTLIFQVFPSYMRRAILKKAKFDIVELNTIKVAKSSFVPVLFGHAGDDDFIHPHHSDRIYEAYMDIHEVGYEDDFLVAPQAPSSTEDAINQLRSKRPMSRTEVPSDIPSTDKQCKSEDEGAVTEHIPSSSKTIDFEFSNGHPYKPSSADDHEYVEYPLQHIEGFPCNIEEEERMLMEAVLLSLKDIEPKQSPSDQRPAGDGKSAFANHSPPIKTDPTTRVSTASSSDSSPSQFMSPCSSASSAEKSSYVIPAVVGSTDTSMADQTKADQSLVSVVGSSDAGMADRVKATITVERSPSSNIMDGLLKRWDLSFFKNR